MINALDISISLVSAAACGVLMPLWIQGMERQKAEFYGKALPYEEWSVKRTVALVAIFVACALLCTFSFDALQVAVASALLCAGVSCAVIDLDLRLIPNQTVIVMAVLGVALRISFGIESLLFGLAAAAVAFIFLLASVLISKALTGRIGMGAGDLKLLVVVSLATGWPGALFMVAGFFCAVAVMAIYQLLYLRLGLQSTFPMAPAIVVGLVCGISYQVVPGISGLLSI